MSLPRQPYERNPAPAETVDGPSAPLQIHHLLNGETRYGEHPDPKGRRLVDVYLQDHKRTKSEFVDYVATAPNDNEVHKSTIETIRTTLAADFGESIQGTPITILGPAEFKRAMQISAGPNYYVRAVSMFGQILLLNDNEAAKYGPNYFVRLGLHEGAHAARQHMGRVIVTTEQSPTKGETPESEQSYHITSYETGGLIANDGNPRWEESFADLYSIRRCKDLGISPSLRGEGDSITLTNGDKVRYANPALGCPNTDMNEGCYYLPWDYCSGAQVNDSTFDVAVSIPGFGAYGLHLLDKRIPSLFDAMLRTRHDPHTQVEVEDMVNRQYPGLYTPTVTRSYNEESLLTMLLEIEDRLGVLESPLEP